MLATAGLFLPLLLIWSDLVSAVKFNVHGLSKRGSISGVGGSEALVNSGDLLYFTNITLNGKQFTVAIDTGSADLYVSGDVPGSKNTGKNAKVTYVIGSAEGPVHTADLDFLGYHVPNQAYIVDSEKDDGTGLIGLGPNANSQIHSALNNDKGNAVIDRIFLQNSSTPNYLTVLLGRSDDPDEADRLPGEITIGELVEGRENITSQPKLPVNRVGKGVSTLNQHWQITLDKHGIFGPDGQPVNITSKSRNLTAILDTGFSLPQVPRSISDAFYSRIPGADFKNVSGLGEVWTVPCNAEVNVTFTIGGVAFPIHPLDTVDVHSTGGGGSVCYGSFQPRIEKTENYDIILGMAWLRNAYMLINFGDFVQGRTDKVADPYIQLLPLTEATEAHEDFVSLRLSGVDTTGGQTLLNNVTPSGPDDPIFENPSKNKSFLDKNKWYLIGGGIGLGVLILGMVIAMVCCRRRRKVAYKSLHEPAPLGDSHYEYKGQH